MKAAQQARKYLPVQLGLCAFLKEANTDNIVATPFTFYMFPQADRTTGRTFSCTTSSMSFLACHNFDFNKLFRKGIPYSSRAEESARRALRQKKFQEWKNEAQFPGPPPVLDERTASYMKEIEDKIKAWHVRATAVDHLKEDDMLVLQPFTSFQRRLIYKHIEAEFSDVDVVKFVPENGPAHRPFMKLAVKSQVERDEARQADERVFEASIELARGLRVLIDAIVELKLPVVGHNFLLVSEKEGRNKSWIDDGSLRGGVNERIIWGRFLLLQFLFLFSRSSSLSRTCATYITRSSPRSLPLTKSSKIQFTPPFHKLSTRSILLSDSSGVGEAVHWRAFELRCLRQESRSTWASVAASMHTRPRNNSTRQVTTHI
jgi:hypothetical protein